MPQVPSRNDPDYADFVIRMASGGSLKAGVLNEPRIFYDVIPLSQDPTLIIAGSPGVFVNGEQYPIRISHLSAALAYLDAEGHFALDSDIQRAAMRLLFHDTFYMNAQFVPVPLWGNLCVAPPQSIATGISHWNLVENGNPFILSARDTLVVTVQLNDATLADYPANLVLAGIGAISKRPYLFNSEVVITGPQRTNLNSVDLRNDGIEPVVITDITVTAGPTLTSTDPTGNISALSINIVQSGNGTGNKWFIGPQTPPPPIPLMPAQLLGFSTGRAVVHQFPGDGLLWNPGDGISVEVQTRALRDRDSTPVLCLALGGNIMVT